MAKEPSPMPDAVIDSVFKAQTRRCPCCEAAERNVSHAHQPLREMPWRGDHYAFLLGTMYVEVELDGYMHT